MSKTTKDATIIAIIMIAAVAIFVGDLHRTVLRAVWPFITSFFDYITL